MNNKHKTFIFASFLTFLFFSFPYTIHGSTAPVMMAYYGITAAQQGFVVTMQSVGIIGTALFIALKGEKYNKIHTIAVGLILICVACAAIGLLPAYTVLIPIVLVLGVGNAFVDIMMNGVVSDVYPNQRNTLLPIVHAFFGAGAMLCPIFVTNTANTADPSSFAQPFRILAIGAAIVFLVYFLSGRRIMPDTPYIDMEAMRRQAAENPAEVFKEKRAWAFLAAGFLYFTFQLGIAMWLPTYTIQNVAADYSTGGLMLTAFFGGALPMRFLGPLFLRKFQPRVLYAVFGWIGAAFMIGAILSVNIPVMFVLVAASGFMQGSNVAVFILLCVGAFPTRTASASSIFSLSAGVATLTAPLWMGVLSGYTGFQMPMILVCCSLAASGLIIFVLNRPASAPR